MSHSPKAKIIRTTTEKFQQLQGLQNWVDSENMKAASKALNKMTVSNPTLEKLGTEAHTTVAKRMTATSVLSKLKDRLNEIEDQIPVVAEYF